MKLADDSPHAAQSDEQGLSAVQNDLDGFNIVFRNMLGNSFGCLRNDLVGHCLRLRTPALIEAFIDVAMIASEIAATMNLQHKLIQRADRTRALAHDSGFSV